jgi:hypothetical protein
MSRRYARAFERLSGPRATSSRALALALVTLVFASGFLLGRVGSVGTITDLRSMPAPKPIPFDGADGVKGSISYLTTSRDEITTVAMHDVFSGDVTGRANFSPPVEAGDHVTTSVTAFGRSVAVVVTSASGQGFIALAPHRQAPQGWILGMQAAWASERELYVRHVDGTVAKWSFTTDAVRTVEAEDADELIQTSAGAVIRRGRTLETLSSPRRTIRLPPGAENHVAAVSPDLMRVLLDEKKAPTLWDGTERVPMANGQGSILGASFDPSSERVAIALRSPDGLMLAVVDQQGDAALKPLGSGDGCPGSPVWDGNARWIYTAGDDGTMYAVEAGGGRVESVRTQAVGCGVAWVDLA